MCGIAGLVLVDPGTRAESAEVERMTRTLVHRGPDGEGVWTSGPVGFGHRRLAILDLSEGLQLRRARVMGANRIELTGFTDTMRDRLKSYGLFGEIISWKFRLFVPTDASGTAVLARLLERFPVERIAEREAA